MQVNKFVLGEVKRVLAYVEAAGLKVEDSLDASKTEAFLKCREVSRKRLGYLQEYALAQAASKGEPVYSERVVFSLTVEQLKKLEVLGGEAFFRKLLS